MRGQGGEARPVATEGDFCAPVAGRIRRRGLFFCSDPRSNRDASGVFVGRGFSHDLDLTNWRRLCSLRKKSAF
jgi:hypothetical protein